MVGINVLSGVRGIRLRILITIAATGGFWLFGYDNALMSGLIVNPWFLKTFNHPKASLLGTISATYNLGGLVGAVIAFFVGERLGRKKTILIGISITTVGAIPFTLATKLGELIAGRIICGIGVGVMSSTVGLWQAETTPAHTRGAFLVGQLLYGATFGLFLAQWINFGFSSTTTRVAFAFPVAFQFVILSVSATLLLLGLPESPRWLVKNQRFDEARDVFERLYPDADARALVKEIQDADALENEAGNGKYKPLFTNGPTQNFRRLCLACGIMTMHQLNGVNSVTYYLPTLVRLVLHTDHRKTLWISGLSSVVSAAGTLPAIFTVDRFGRKPFLVYGTIVQVATFTVIAALLATGAAENQTRGIAAITVLFFYYCINSMCWLGQSWAYPAEILPLSIRERGLALGNCFYFAFQFMMVEITPIAIANVYYKFYIMLAVFNLVIVLIIWKFYEETAGLTLEQIDFVFAKRYSPGTVEDREFKDISAIEHDTKQDENSEHVEGIRKEQEA